MGSGLVHIINREIFSRKKHPINAVGLDLDGNITDLHKPEIYELIWENVLGFLPISMRRSLQRHSIHDLIKSVNIKPGYFIDLALGYIVIADSNGKILTAKKGNECIRKEELFKAYGSNASIDTSYSFDLDHSKPRFLPYGDGFDFLECCIKTALTAMGGYPRNYTNNELGKAFYQAHQSENGFKRLLFENPERYGIKSNKQLKEFMERLHLCYKTFLLTNSPENYTNRILDAMDIHKYFDIVISNAKKPACFLPDSFENKNLTDKLKSIGLNSLSEIFYVGDNLYKDVIPANKSGILTALRAKRTEIYEIERKLRKYAGVRFKADGPFIILEKDVKKSQIGRLNNILLQLYEHVHALTTKVQNLEPLLLY